MMVFSTMVGSWCNDVDSDTSRSRRRSIANHYNNKNVNTRKNCPVGSRCNVMYFDTQGSRTSCTFHGSILHDNSRTIILQPIRRERVVEVMVEEIHERVVHVPRVEYVDKFVQVVKPVVKYKIKQVKRPVIKERIKNVSKVVEEEKIVHVPEYQYVDKYVDVPTVIEKEKIVEVPIPIVKERLVPKLNILTKERIQELDTVEFQIHETGEAHLSERIPEEQEPLYENYVTKNAEAIDSNVEAAEELLKENHFPPCNTESGKASANDVSQDECGCGTHVADVLHGTQNDTSPMSCAQGGDSDPDCTLLQGPTVYTEENGGEYVGGDNDVSIEVGTFQQDCIADSTLFDRFTPDESSNGAYTTLDVLYKNMADFSISAHTEYCTRNVAGDQDISVSDQGASNQSASISVVGNTITAITHQGGDSGNSTNRLMLQNGNVGHGTSTTTLYAHLDYRPRSMAGGLVTQPRDSNATPHNR